MSRKSSEDELLVAVTEESFCVTLFFGGKTKELSGDKAKRLGEQLIRFGTEARKRSIKYQKEVYLGKG